MKTFHRRPSWVRDFRSGRTAPSRAGIVLPTVIVLLLTISLVVGLLARFSVRSIRLARRTIDVQRAFVVAEAGLGYGVMRVKNMLVDGGVSGFYANYSSIATPPSPDDEYELRLLVNPISASSSGGATVSEEGSIEVISGARNLESGVSCALRVTIGAIGESLSDYAVFYDGDLEANVGDANSSLTFVGKIHANGNIYVSKNVVFDHNLTCNGTFLHRRKTTMTRDDNNGDSRYRKVFLRYGDDKEMSASEKESQRLVNTWNGTTYIDEEIGSDWIAQSSLYYGNAIQTGQNGIPKLSPPISVDDVQHTLIEPPKASSDPNYHPATEAQKFANKAALTLHVYPDGSFTLKDNTEGGGTIISRDESLSKQSELYSPGYWKGQYTNRNGETKDFTWPGWWHGSYQAAPWTGQSWMRNVQWVPSYTPPKDENDTRWINNYPGIQIAETENNIGGFMIWDWNSAFGSPLDGYSWADSVKNELNTSVSSAGPAHRVYYAKSPKTGSYYLKKKGVGVQTVHKDSADPDGVDLLGNLFFDRRQGYMMAPTDIYLDEFLDHPGVKAALANAPGGEVGIGKILYIEMDDPELVKGPKCSTSEFDENGRPKHISPLNVLSDGYPLPCVRIRNGADPGTDLSIVTDLPVYVEGDFNTTQIGTHEDGSAKYRSTLIAGDRITQLSKQWQDGNFIPCVGGLGGAHEVHVADNFGKIVNGAGANVQNLKGGAWTVALTDARRDAANTTLNSVIMTGIFPSTIIPGNTNVEKGYSGGLENILRYLEDWGGKESRFNGSIICLWDTQKFDRTWESPGTAVNSSLGGGNVYYKAPKRIWSYNHMTPPGMPGFFAVREATWERVAWNSVDWGGEEGGGGEGGGEEGGG